MSIQVGWQHVMCAITSFFLVETSFIVAGKLEIKKDP